MQRRCHGPLRGPSGVPQPDNFGRGAFEDMQGARASWPEQRGDNSTGSFFAAAASSSMKLSIT